MTGQVLINDLIVGFDVMEVFDARKECGEIFEVEWGGEYTDWRRYGMKKVLYRYLLLFILGTACLAGCASRKGDEEEKESGMENETVSEDKANMYDFLVSGDTIDLGNHIAAYLMAGEKIDMQYEGTEYLVVRDLEKETSLCVPNSFGELLDVSTCDTGIRVKYTDNGTETETVLPVRFPDRDGECLEMNPIKEKAMYGTDFRKPELPVKVWDEILEGGGEKRRVSFYRTSPPYKDLNNDFMGRCADYLLTVEDGEGNTVWKRAITNYQVFLEEVHWMVDVSGDGYTDIIFCTDYISQPLPNVQLRFLLWDGEQGKYVLRNPINGYGFVYGFVNGDVYGYGYGPLWNEEMSGFVFYEKGFNNWVYDTKMYTCTGGEWRLAAEIITDSENRDKPYFEDRFQEETYYKELDYFEREIIYRGDETMEIVHDGAWDGRKDYYDREKYLKLYPEEEWELVEMVLDTGGTVNKYVRKTGSDRSGSD